MINMIKFLYSEGRKLRCFHIFSMSLRGGFRNYWFGEDMPWFRSVPWLQRMIEGPPA